MSASNHSSCTTIKHWEQAGTSLLATLKDYMDICLGLPHSLSDPIQPNDLATKIDSTTVMISDQLLKISSTLARTRNHFVPLLHLLPEEILASIFMNVVFDRTHPITSKSPSVNREVRLIYRRLYALFSVCSAWRDFLMSRGVFWSIIPLISKVSTENQAPFELYLQRARRAKLHLVVISVSLDTSKDLMEVLDKYCPRLYAINFHLIDHEVIVEAVDKLLHSAPGSLAELSIQCTRLGASSSWIPVEDDYVVCLEHPHQAQLTNLMKGLSAFRVCGAHFRWQTLAFSARLVELHMDCITLGYDREIYPFLRALSTASGLRDLRLIMLDTFYEPDSSPSAEGLSPIALPNLQSLYIENIYFNTLRLLLPMIAPGSHCLTLFINQSCLRNNLFDHDEAMIENSELDVDITELCGVLEKVPTDTLILNGCWEQWPPVDVLHDFLKTMPALKTLKLHNWEFDIDVWRSLMRPRSSKSNPPESLHSFPALETLHLTSALIITEEGFQDMVASHPLQQIVLGATTETCVEGDKQRRPFEDSSPTGNWLRDNVPEFSLVDIEDVPPEIQIDHHCKWQLW